MLNKNRVVIVVLFLILQEKLSVFVPLSIRLTEGVFVFFLIYSLYYDEIRSRSTYFVEHFYHEWMLYFVKCFSSSIEIIAFYPFMLM